MRFLYFVAIVLARMSLTKQDFLYRSSVSCIYTLSCCSHEGYTYRSESNTQLTLYRKKKIFMMKIQNAFEKYWFMNYGHK